MRLNGLRILLVGLAMWGVVRTALDFLSPSETSDRPVQAKEEMEDDPGRWVPLTEEEKRLYQEQEAQVCGHPLQHCCVGQCRRLVDKHDNASSLYVQWSKPLANLTNVIEYMAQQDIPCNLWFVGYSTTGDQAIGALCELMREGGYELAQDTECVDYSNSQWNESTGCGCKGFFQGHGGECTIEQGLPNAQFYTLVHPDKKDCPIVTVGHSGTSTFMGSYEHIRDKAYYQKGGVMIWNHGVHCNERTICIGQELNSSLAAYVAAQKQQLETNSNLTNPWHILYREAEHQHFPTATGYYVKGWQNAAPKSGSVCTPIQRLDDWRNSEAQDFLDQLYAITNVSVPIISLSNATEPLHFMHSTSMKDCTHYCYSPWRFKLTWEGMLKGLQELVPPAT
ncbi:hypothetical protein ACHAWO_013086 [Cyclotella atomus]|uniref:Uncharacterized protein n=1 Tax=Cyclotella atomus TaxID=382360 RepID=A0ABD3NHA4_9STRA